MRPTREQLMMRFAFDVRERSTCCRLHVGAVVATADARRVLGYGYNGNARGLSHCSDPIPRAVGVRATVELIEHMQVKPGQCPCVHAELNALLSAGDCRGAVLYTTHSPCPHCARAIVNAGIASVWFAREYRLHEGIDILLTSGIDCHALPSEMPEPL